MKREHPLAPIHIRIYLRGGIIEGAETLDREPVYVEVFDYDTNGIHDDDLCCDGNGASVWRYTC